MLREFVEKKHYIFVDKVSSWEESIRVACKPIEEDGTVDSSYAEQIISCIKKYGPYIIIIPNVAMPHSQEGAQGVHKTAVSFMKVKEPVSFAEGDDEKNATLFFTLASCNSEEHMKNMVRLSEMLMNEELVKELMKVESSEELLILQEKYLD